MLEYKCIYCECSSDLRPYGPKGALVCFPCAMRPDRKAETERQLAMHLGACGDSIILTPSGPIPADGSKYQ